MENYQVSLPDVEKVSSLITALSDYAAKSAREQWAQKMSSKYITPRICCWDERTWLELAKDQQVVNYLLSDLAGAWVLMRSLHFCLRWYGQAEIDRLQNMEVVIETNQEQNDVDVMKSSDFGRS
jgi:hypothetical protein